VIIYDDEILFFPFIEKNRKKFSRKNTEKWYAIGMSEECMSVVLLPGMDEIKKISTAKTKVKIIETYLLFSIHSVMKFIFYFYLYNFIL